MLIVLVAVELITPIEVALSLSTMVSLFTPIIGVRVGLLSIWITGNVEDLSDLGLWIVSVAVIFFDTLATLSSPVEFSVG